MYNSLAKLALGNHISTEEMLLFILFFKKRTNLEVIYQFLIDQAQYVHFLCLKIAYLEQFYISHE